MNDKPYSTCDDTLFGRKWRLATVTEGEFSGETVCIMVVFADEQCIVERSKPNSTRVSKLPDDMVLIPLSSLHLWATVDHIDTRPKYVPFTWEDRDQIRGKWVVWTDDNGVKSEHLICSIVQYPYFVTNVGSAAEMLDHCVFLDTGEPVGKKVDPTP